MQECRPEFSAPRAAAVHTVPDNVQPPPPPPPDKEKTEIGRERTFVGGRVRLHAGYENLFGIKGT